jgi:hypothetical protein
MAMAMGFFTSGSLANKVALKPGGVDIYLTAPSEVRGVAAWTLLAKKRIEKQQTQSSKRNKKRTGRILPLLMKQHTISRSIDVL